MKLKKLVGIILIAVILMIILGMFQVSNAAIGSKFLTIKKLRESGYGYETLEKNVWEIVETNSIGGDIDYSATIYCLKGGPGFGSTDLGNGNIAVREYTRYFDMKTPDQIDSAYRDALPTDTNTYNALLWLLEHVYISPVNDDDENEVAEAEAYKEQLLIAAGIDYEYCYLTEDDIDAVQQLAVWHFTNDDVYDPGTTLPSLWVNAVADTDGNYYALTDEEGAGGENGKYRQEDAAKLYNYLITEAEANAANYEPTPAGQPYEFDNSNLTQSIEEENGNYIIGPFKINRISDTEGTLEATFVNGEGTTLYPTYQDASGRRINNLEDAVGQEFYIVLPNTTNVDTITFTISGTYAETSVQYWSVVNAPESDQPVAIVERTEKDYSDEATFVKPEEEVFDLALRKFVTSITSGAEANMPEIIIPENREPQISEDTINDLEAGRISTAEKLHSKNALVVATGDRVVYTIRVYNEGDIAGYVKEITDYLPEGLRFVEDSSINTQYGWTSADGRTITTDITSPNTANSESRDQIYAERKEGADKVILDALTGGEIDYIDVQIECEVVASTSQNNTSLKNIAEITRATDSNGESVTDRDSVPNNLTDDQKQNYNPGTSEQGWGYEDDDDFENLVILGQYFDLSLRKFVVQVNDNELKDNSGNYLREPRVDLSTLLSAESTTAIYNHPKDPVEVAVGDEIIYTLRIYNEGQIDGYVYEITDYLPANLEFVNDEFNAKYGWKISEDGRTVTTDITSPDTQYSASRDTIFENRKDGTDKVILEAFDGINLDYIDVQIKVKVKDTAVQDEKLTNIAEITDFRNVNREEVTDRDSVKDNITLPSDETLPNYRDEEINRGDAYIPGQEDDDDFEKVIIQKFDLALRKFITGLNEETVTGREPVFSIENGEYVYTHTKEPVKVATDDIVFYTLRIYNEGDIAGYAEEVKDEVPDGLEFLPENTTNINYRWVMYDAEGNVTEDASKAVTIRTDYLSKAQEDETGRDNVIDAFDPDTMSQPDYKEVRIAFRVIEPNTSNRVIINTAEISNDSNEEGEPVEDVDSTPDNDEDGEDDIDIEQIEVQCFDLALRKFITGINEAEITNREPVFSIEDGQYVYNHPKDTVEVANGDTVIYTLRIFNEGTMAGYAEEVKDDVPEGLEFLPENEINTEYRWVMYDANGEVTEDVSQAVTIRTDYLSKAQEDETERDNLLDAFDPDTMDEPNHRDVKVAFKVTEPNTSDRIIINTAEISEDENEDGEPVDDIDSTPDNDEDGEDDIDKEQIKVTYFDLALKKIITKVTMILDGKTYVDETGHTFEDNPEEVVKVELGNHKIETSVIKFTYQIRVTNEGNKPGYAYEVKDYIPEGVEFVAEDNNEHWTLSEDGKTVTSDELADTLLGPGESATIEITLRWINGQNNLGVKTNWAEISEDSDDDIDSTPDNNTPGEDDIDNAEVVLSIVTGIGGHYIGVITGVLAILGVGIFLIKRYVL